MCWDWLCLGGKKSQGCLLGAAAPHLKAGPEQRNEHLINSWASAKPKRWQLQEIRWTPPTGTQDLAIRPCFCLRFQHSGRTICCRQHEPRAIRQRGDVRGCTGRPVAKPQRSGSLKPIGRDSYPSKSSVSAETTNRRIYSDMSGPLSDKPFVTTHHARVFNAYLPGVELSIRLQFSFHVLVTLIPSWLGCMRPILAVWRPK